MISSEDLCKVLYSVIDQLNSELPADRRLDKSFDTVLFGADSSLDSLGVVNLIVATEQQVQQQLGIAMVLTDDRVMSQIESKLRTVRDFAEAVAQLSEESTGD